MTANLARNWQLVRHTETALRTGNESLGNVPALLRSLLEEEAWRKFALPSGEAVSYRRFSAFVAAPPPRGLGADMGLVKRIAGDDTELLDMIDQAERSGQTHGGDRRSSEFIVSNIHDETVRPAGTSKARALRKLRKDAPELHAEVLANRLSAHAAMVRAGFRPKTVSVPVDAPDSIARALRRHLTPEQIAQLIALLLPGGDDP